MPRFAGLLLTLAGFTALSGCAKPLAVVEPAAVGMSKEKLGRVDEIVGGLIEQQRLAGAAVMIARRGRVCFFNTYGMMDIERDKPMREDTIFRIYSMSKAITTAAVMQLVEQGRIGITDPIGRYIPDMKSMAVFEDGKSRPANGPVTVEHLMLHTSGLVYGAPGAYGKLVKQADAMNRGNTLKEMTERMAATPLKFEPGSDWAYGTSVDVLGRLVEIVSGQPLDEYLQRHLFEPLGMTDTGFYVPAAKVRRFAANYRARPKGRLTLKDDPATSRYRKKPALLSGGGGLVGTISDYMRFLLAIRNGGQLDGRRILKPETVALMTGNHLPKKIGWISFGTTVRDGVGFGYGFSVCVQRGRFDPARKVGDYGWGGAASTHFWVSPRDDLVVVTMEQTMPFSFLLENKLKPVIAAAVE